MGLLARLGNYLKTAVGLVLPLAAKTRQLRRWSGWLRWTLHAVLVLVVLLVLGYLNRLLGLAMLLETPWSVLRQVWLPLLFLLIYALAWVGWWLWQLLAAQEPTSAFPDIDQAWREVVAALDRAGIELTEVPLFLILGRPVGPLGVLSRNAPLQLAIRKMPRDPQAPLSVYANRDGIFVTARGASLLGRWIGLLAGEAISPDETHIPTPAAASLPARTAAVETIPPPRDQPPAPAEAPAASPPPHPAAAARAKEPEPPPPQGTETAKEEHPPATVKRRPLLLRNAEEVERCTARLEHLCSLIARDRQPYCPINGILLLLPWNALDSDADASQTGSISQHDLVAARAVLQVHCPLIALICDMEQASGFAELVDLLPEEQRLQLVGQRFPLLPDLDAKEVPKMIARGIAWWCRTGLPRWWYQLFRLEPAAGQVPERPGLNARLYQLLFQLQQREERLTRVLTRAVVPEDGGPMLFGGCYLTGFGRQPSQESAFAAQVFGQLLENQNYVAWTAEARQAEAAYRRWTLYGYGGVIVLALALLRLGYSLWLSG